MWKPTIIFDMWMEPYKLWKNVVNIEKSLDTYEKRYVLMNHSSILEIENKAKDNGGQSKFSNV